MVRLGRWPVIVVGIRRMAGGFQLPTGSTIKALLKFRSLQTPSTPERRAWQASFYFVTLISADTGKRLAAAIGVAPQGHLYQILIWGYNRRPLLGTNLLSADLKGFVYAGEKRPWRDDGFPSLQGEHPALHRRALPYSGARAEYRQISGR